MSIDAESAQREHRAHDQHGNDEANRATRRTSRRAPPRRVTRDGDPDPSRPVLYLGEAQLVTSVGALPIAFEIEATSLGEAAEKFAAAAEVGVERTMRQLQDLRSAMAQIVVKPP